VPRHRSHIALTVWPITVLFVLELARTWPALDGATSFAAASPVTWLSLLAYTFVVIVFLGAYARGWNALSRESPSGSDPYRSEGCRRLQKLAGGLAWALVVAHLTLHWFMTVRVGPVALSHYELLRGFLSRPPVLGFYVLGLAALGLFLSQGVAASFRAWGLGRRPESSRWLEGGCTLVSAVMVLMAINVLSHFVTGRAYWMGS
jgi:hypothetical protein